MKTTIAIITFILIGFGVKAMPGDKSISYVIAGDKVYFGENLKVGMFNTKIIATDGTVIKIPNRDVKSYMHDSKLFESLPAIGENRKPKGHKMMQYITARSGLKLYRSNCVDSKGSWNEYLVFKDGRYYLRIDQENATSTLPFFGIAVLQ